MPGKEPHQVEQLFLLKTGALLLEKAAGRHLGGELVGHRFHRLTAVPIALRSLNQYKELIAIAEFLANLAGSTPLRITAAEHVGQLGFGAKVVNVGIKKQSQNEHSACHHPWMADHYLPQPAHKANHHDAFSVAGRRAMKRI